MHWYPLKEKPLDTTACRDCLPRQLYVHTPVDGVHAGTTAHMCTWTREAIEIEMETYGHQL
jgi:hypothetical protein